ncbi:hypothetical protein JRQ81_018594 [Phrynocephalus forsythii]|uniref:Uncharacterized protein n=1 Tax=Phrynocephalus forsythii TaxID=171643 RepID=A0A9Q1AZQ9_9SAUR|nr:hypothetical protein JRQ81_018594 [Phrynocephalus forsythii]
MKGLMNMKNKLLSHMNIPCLTGLSKEIIFRSTSPRLLCLKIDTSSTQSRKENNNLVNTLTVMGVDINLVRKRQPGVLRKKTTKENDLKNFLHAKGFCNEDIASIITRYPRCITRSHNSLQKRWEIWQKVLMTDSDIAKILERSPENFFRSGNNKNMMENIAYFLSLGLTFNALAKMLTIIPRAFSSTVELNKQMVSLLWQVYVDVGGENPADFVKQIISKNALILTRSRKQVTANIQLLKSDLNLENEQLRMRLCGQGGDILHLSNEYLKKNLTNIKNKLLSHGCTEADVITFVSKNIRVLYTSADKMNDKIDILLQAKINVHQILKSSLVINRSNTTISSRIDALRKLGYDFETQTVGILELSKARFEARLKKMQHNANE